jgi:hypothetical protein
MKAEIHWNKLKSERLKRTRAASFEDILSGKLLATKNNPARAGQKIMLIEYKGYVWVVPYVKNEEGVRFLKTLFPSRKYTKMHKEGKL